MGEHNPGFNRLPYKLTKKEEAAERRSLKAKIKASFDASALFHHVHHEDGNHSIHHCGGELPAYRIKHCDCGLHSSDSQYLSLHLTPWRPEEIIIDCVQECDGGGWHLEFAIMRLNKTQTKIKELETVAEEAEAVLKYNYECRGHPDDSAGTNTEQLEKALKKVRDRNERN